MREYRSYGSVRGAVGNNRPYREQTARLNFGKNTLTSATDMTSHASRRVNAGTDDGRDRNGPQSSSRFYRSFWVHAAMSSSPQYISPKKNLSPPPLGNRILNLATSTREHASGALEREGTGAVSEA